MKVTIMGPNLFGAPETFHVHAEGCRDLGKRLYRGSDGGWSIEAASVQQVVEDVYSDIIAESPGVYGGADGWQNLVSEFRFFPCADSLP